MVIRCLHSENRPAKECVQYCCSDHEYLELTRQEYDDLKIAGVLYCSKTGQHYLTDDQKEQNRENGPRIWCRPNHHNAPAIGVHVRID